MCGIAGFYRFSNKQEFDKNMVISCIKETHSRGGDAVGIYSPSFGTVKAPGDADKFCKKHNEDIEKAAKEKFLLIHNRRAASGWRSAPPDKNENNHPHDSENWVLIHNGILSASPPIKDYQYSSTCDSEIALSYLQEWGLRGLELLCDDDGFSLAFVEKKTGTLYLIRHRNPLVYAYERLRDAVIFGSTVEIGRELSGAEEVRGITCMSNGGWWHLDENKLYKVTDQGLELAMDTKFMWTKATYREQMKRDKRIARLELPVETTTHYHGNEHSQSGFFPYGTPMPGNTSGDNRSSTAGSSAGKEECGIDITNLYLYPTEGGIIYAKL